MNWFRTLRHPIALRDGREIGTLAAAHILMRSLPEYERRQAVWRDVGELLAEAAVDESWISDFEAELSLVLKAEGHIN